MKTTLNVKQFTDYRTFLVAYAQDKKRDSKDWSYGGWAKRLGLKTTSSITKIIKGERDPGDQVTELLVNYFKFADKEAAYFRDLVRLHKIRKDPRLAVLLMEKMNKQFPDGTVRILDDKKFRVISNWYYLPLREMTRMPGFKADPDEIATKFKFKVTPREIKEAINTMIDVGLLVRDAQGQLRVAEGRIDTTNDVASEGLKRFHEQNLENAKAAVRSVDVLDREIRSSCFVFKTSNMPLAKQMLREFAKKFAQTFEEPNGDAVYHVQINFFPLTKKRSTQVFGKITGLSAEQLDHSEGGLK